MSQIFVDTSFLIALYQSRDEYHATARRFAEQSFRLLTSQWILAEFASAFSRVADRRRAVDLIDGLQASSGGVIVPASPEWFRRGLELFRVRSDKEWSLVDCVSFEIMKEYGVFEALTADRHFEQAGFVALLNENQKKSEM